MSRIFVSLSILPILLVLITMGAGLWIGDYNGTLVDLRASDGESPPTDEELLADWERIRVPQQRFNWHFQLGLASALSVVLINCLSVTYLIGTSRWVKEVCEAYGLDAKYFEEISSLKRRTFPWSILGVSAILGIIALGAAADPGTLRAGTEQFVKPHFLVAIMGTCCIVWAIIVQASNLRRNAQLIERVVDEVRQERLARGLPVDPSVEAV